MEIVFWLGVVPLVGLIVWVAATVRLTGLDRPLESLPTWQRELRLFLFPKVDATPEELAQMRQDQAARAEASRHQRLVSTVLNTSGTGRGP